MVMRRLRFLVLQLRYVGDSETSYEYLMLVAGDTQRHFALLGSCSLGPGLHCQADRVVVCRMYEVTQGG